MAPLDLAAAWAMPRGPRDHLSTTSYSKATPSGSFSLNHSSARSGLANTLISTRQGWLVSIPGDPEMRFRALAGFGTAAAQHGLYRRADRRDAGYLFLLAAGYWPVSTLSGLI
jgi:hypothetical protein